MAAGVARRSWGAVSDLVEGFETVRRKSMFREAVEHVFTDDVGTYGDIISSITEYGERARNQPTQAQLAEQWSELRAVLGRSVSRNLLPPEREDLVEAEWRY